MVRPKKHLGQHFLTDQHLARKIVEAIDPETENLLEIGPGKGILTRFILENKPKCFRVIEIDRESVDYLQVNFPELAPDILFDDFLKIDLKTIFPECFSVIGNFPYNISSQILFKVLGARSQVDEVVGMFQKEVADRIISPPGSKKYGILSVLVQAFYRVENLFAVSEGSFFPPPRVKSAVIRLRRNDVKQLDCDESLFFDLVKTAFNQRRKTLRNALKKFTLSQSEIAGLLDKRAEQLEVADFITLVNAVAPR